MNDYELLRPFMSEERHRRIAEVLSARTSRLVLVAENFYDPHNLSAILRTADALGIQHVILTGAAPSGLNPLVALGAERWLTVDRIPDQGTCLADLKARGYSVAAAALTPCAIPLQQWEPAGPVALTVGNEHEGLSQAFLAGADAIVQIPLQGFSRSLNVSVAAGILLWALLQKKALRARGLPDGEARTLREIWARRSVDNSDAILKRLRNGEKKQRCRSHRRGAEDAENIKEHSRF